MEEKKDEKSLQEKIEGVDGYKSEKYTSRR